MKKIGLVIFGIALVVGVVFANILSFGRLSDRMFNVSFDLCGTKGSGNVVSERRDISEFSGIDVGGIYKVDVTIGEDFSVEIETDDNLLPLISTEVDGDVLKIESSKRFKPSDQVRVHVTAPDIRSLDISGAARIEVTGVANDELTVDASGASKVNLSGETQKLTVDVSGATSVDAEQLTAQDAAVDSSGAGNVAVNVTGELRADGSGASKIYYSGSPATVVKKTSGAGKVVAR